MRLSKKVYIWYIINNSVQRLQYRDIQYPCYGNLNIPAPDFHEIMGISSYNKKHTPFFGVTSLEVTVVPPLTNHTTWIQLHRKLRIHPWNMLIGKIAELLCFKRNIALYKSNDLIQFLFVSPVSELAWVSPMSTLMGVWTLTCKKFSVFVHENHLPLLVNISLVYPQPTMQ